MKYFFRTTSQELWKLIQNSSFIKNEVKCVTKEFCEFISLTHYDEQKKEYGFLMKTNERYTVCYNSDPFIAFSYILPIVGEYNGYMLKKRIPVFIQLDDIYMEIVDELVEFLKQNFPEFL